MRIVAVFALLLFTVSAARAQQPKIDSIEIISAGLYSTSERNTKDDPSISTGRRTTAKTIKLIERATVMKLKRGMVIGITVRVNGKPKGKSAPLTVKWRYPEPGIKNPDTGTSKLNDEYETSETIGDETFFYWNLDADYVLVPGEWIVELRSGGRLLANQLFTLER